MNKKITQNGIYTRWSAFAFLCAVFSLYVSFVMLPVFLSRIYMRMDNSSEVLKISLCIFPQQTVMVLGIFAALLISGKEISFKDKLLFKNWKASYFLNCLKLELALVPVLFLSVLLFRFLLEFLNIPYQMPAINKILVKSSWTSFAVIAFAAVVLAPVIEELIFRRLIFDFVNRLTGRNFALIAVSALFAGVHYTLIQFPGLFILGIFLQLLYLKHKSIYPPLILHFYNNFLFMFLMLLVRLSGMGGFEAF